MKIRSFYYGLLSRTLLFLFLILFLTNSAQAGSISGNVYELGGTTPVVGLWVSLHDASTGARLFNVKTDSTGFYTFSELSAGTYKVEYYTSGTDYAYEWYNDQITSSAATTIPLSDVEDKVLDPAFLGTAGGEITGTVTVEGSVTPIEGVYVQAYNMDDDFVEVSKTDGNGKYFLTGLRDGDYYVRFYAGEVNYVTEWFDDTTISDRSPVTVPGGSSGVDAQLVAGGSISGRVTYHETGEPVVDAWVEAYDGSGTWRGYARTNGNGEYRVPGLPTGSHKLHVFEFYGASLNEWYQDKASFDTATSIDVIAGEDRSGKDVLLGGPVVSEPNFNWLLFIPAITHRPTAP